MRNHKRNKHNNRRKSYLPHVIAGAALIIIGTIGAGKVAEYVNKHSLINNPTGVEKRVIEKGDSYWSFAGQMKEDFPCLKGYDIREVVDTLREYNKTSPGVLEIGQEIDSPIYDCE